MGSGVASVLWPQSGVFLIGLFALATLVLIANEYRKDAVPIDFSVAEKVKYRLGQLAENCRSYNDLVDDPKEVSSAARRCRMQARGLAASVRQFSGGGAQEGEAPPPDLFTRDLSDFAARITELGRLISNLLLRRDRIPNPLIDLLESLSQQIEWDHSRYGDGHRTTLEMALDAAKKTGAVSDETLGASPRQILTTWIRTKAQSLPAVWRFAVIALPATFVFATLVFTVPSVSSFLSLGEKIMGVLTFLGVLAAIWGILRK